MGRNRNTSTTQQVDRQAPEQYPELNATLYDSDPATYLRFRLHTLVAMYNETDSSGDEVLYGNLRMPKSEDFDPKERSRAIALESTMLVHHAGESLMRLYLAHDGHGRCPWITVSKLTFDRVKPQVRKFADPDFEWPDGDLERVFLGGATPEEAGIDVSQPTWTEAASAFREIMRLTAERVTTQAALYNAAKHGLVGVPSERLSLSFKSQEGDDIGLAEGPTVTYLRHPQGSGGKWSAQTDVVDIETDFATVQLITVALHNLWSVARRRYLGQAGGIYLLEPKLVNHAFFMAATGKTHLARGISVQLHEKVTPDAPWGEGLGPGKITLHMLNPPRNAFDAQGLSDEYVRLEPVELPLRDTDTSPFTGKLKHLFPFSPSWSSTF